MICYFSFLKLFSQNFFLVERELETTIELSDRQRKRVGNTEKRRECNNKENKPTKNNSN